jgi:hypothetical protein
MRSNILAIAFILFVFGLLVMNRFDFQEKESITVRRDTESTYSIGHIFKRGELIQTRKGEFIEVSIGSSVRIYLDENTNLNLKSLSKNNLRVGFGHGRILVRSMSNESALTIDTPTAQHILKGTNATFVGYDFKKMTSIIPLSGSIRTTIPLLNQTFDTSTPITIHDVNPPTIEPAEFDQKTDARAEFYQWAEQK